MSKFIGFSGNVTKFNDLSQASGYRGASALNALLSLTGVGLPVHRLMSIMHGYANGDHPLFSMAGYVVFAHCVSEHNLLRQEVKCDNPDALFAGLVSATWMVDFENPPTNDATSSYVHQIANMIAENHPTLRTHLVNALLHLKNVAIPNCGNTSEALVNNSNSAYAISKYDLANSYGAKVLTILDAGGLPWPQWGLTIAQVHAAVDRNALINLIPNNLGVDWDQNWTGDTIIKICNFVGRHIPETIKLWLLRAMFISTGMISKNGTATPTWISSRWKTLCDQFPDVGQGSATPTPVTMADFHRNFIGSKPTVGHLYAALGYNYRIATAMDISIIRWICEQARGANLMALNAVAHCLARYDMFSYTIITRLIPTGQFKAAFMAMRATIVQPFITLVNPVIPVILYADLAYLCLAIYHGRVGDLPNILSSLKPKLVVGSDKLDTLVIQVKTCQEEGAKTALDMSSIIRSYNINAYPDKNSDCSVWAYNEFANADVENADGEAVGRKNLANISKDEFEEIKHQLRSYTVKDIVRNQQVEQDVAAKTIANQFLTSLTQAELNMEIHFPEGMTEVPDLPVPEGIEGPLTMFAANGPHVQKIKLQMVPVPNEYEIVPFPDPVPA